VSLHWLPTSVMGTASLILLILPVCFSEPSPLTATANGDLRLISKYTFYVISNKE
jgi:hypothetical protein